MQGQPEHEKMKIKTENIDFLCQLNFTICIYGVLDEDEPASLNWF